MVSMPSWVSILDRKLLRDLWAMKGQAVAIAVVIGAGVTMYVTYLSNFDSLQRTRAAYYQQAGLQTCLRRSRERRRDSRSGLPPFQGWRRLPRALSRM